MNITKIFFTLTFFFSLALVSQAQVNGMSSDLEGTMVTANNKEVKEIQVEENFTNNTNTTTQTSTTEPAESNIIQTNTITTNTYRPAESNITETNTIVFYFKHKQFMKPITRKTALC